MRDEREKTNQTIFDMFMACHSQEEIAEAAGVPRQTITDLRDMPNNLANSVLVMRTKERKLSMYGIFFSRFKMRPSSPPYKRF